MNDSPASESPEVVTSNGVGSSALFASLVEKARACKVPRVVASTQYGRIGLLLAAGGPNNNGILYRDDASSHADREALAEEINAALVNDQVEARRK